MTGTSSHARAPRRDPREAIARLSGLPLDRLTDDCLLSEIAPDSFAMVELVLALQEEAFELSPSRPPGELRTLGELLRALGPDHS